MRKSSITGGAIPKFGRSFRKAVSLPSRAVNGLAKDGQRW